ncbi:MAG TPA: NAD(P)H-dependent oxidoreductase [Dermatophilaceae bacterium]|nr:NAD(P)H-dependent oxidoreductase [Dermatophilaceae bacterium]
MARLLVVHHTPSPALQELLQAALEGARDEALAGLEVRTRPALVAGPVDVLAADGVLLGTPANIGYMSGALKHFFDTVFYPCLQDTAGLPYGVWVHGNDDTAGATRAVGQVAGALRWRVVGPPVEVVGRPGRADVEAVGELAASVGAAALGMI